MSLNPPELPKGSEPWHLEPSFGKWREPTTGLQCMILRQPIMGALLGYVRIPRDHPHYGRSRRWADYLEVHGGVTFTGRLTHYRAKHHWWVGFDTLHAYDLMPHVVKLLGDLDLPGPPGIYRDWAYVVAQTNALAVQVASKT